MTDKIGYSYSLFRNGVMAGKFFKELESSGIDVAQVVKETSQLDVYYNTLPSTGQQETIRELISSHAGNLENYTKIFSISKDGGKRFSSIKEAVTEIGMTGVTYQVYPGTYYEDNPINLAPGCTVRGISAANIVIVPTNPDKPVFNVAEECVLKKIQIHGGNKDGGIGVNYVGPPNSLNLSKVTLLDQIIINDCQTALHVENPTAVLYVKNAILKPSVNTKSLVQLVNANVSFSSCSLMGIPGKTPVGLSCTLGRLTFASVSCYFCKVGLKITNSRFDNTTCFMGYCGVAILADGVMADTNCNGLVIEDCVTDLHITADTGKVAIVQGKLDPKKLINEKGVKVNAMYNPINETKQLTLMQGTIQIGQSKQPSKLIIGGGKYQLPTIYKGGTAVTNVTGTGDVLLGDDFVIYGFKLDISAGSTDFTVQADFGSGFTDVHCMILDSNYKKVLPPLSPGKYQVRLGITSSTPWVKTVKQDKELYWLRLNMKENTSIKLIELHNNATEFNKDGYQELFGDSRQIRSLLSLGCFSHDGTYSDYSLKVTKLSWYGEMDYDSSMPLIFDFFMANGSTGTVTVDINSQKVVESYPVHASKTKFTVKKQLVNVANNILDIKIDFSNTVSLSGVQVKATQWNSGQHL